MSTMFNIAKLSILALLCLITMQAVSQNTISIQSTLKSISGDAVPDGMQALTFNLYEDLDGGTSIWTEMADVEVVSGIYSHELGSITALNANDFKTQLYLGVTINGTELSPRTKLGYAPYAFAVSSLAASGESASFDSNGKFNVTKDMSVATGLTVGGTLTSSGITNTGNISSTALITADEIRVGGTGAPAGNLDIAINDANTGISGSSSSLNLYADNNTPRVTILSNGRVGIGTTSPETMLHVAGTNTASAIPGEGADGLNPNNYFSGFTRDISTDLALFVSPPGAGNAFPVTAYIEGSILAEERVMAGVVESWSDERIKTNIQASDPVADLALLNAIEITEYDHIDRVKKDTRRQKKVIAQQVAKVLPNAIGRTTMVIPNVYEVAIDFDYKDGLLRVTTQKAHDFVIGDKVDLVTPTRDLDKVEVIAVEDAHTFAIHTDVKPENVFVYGKYVDDFLSVDYDAIAMLNVSATQEMYRMILDLQQANNKLIKENKALKAGAASIEDRLASLEAMIAGSATTSTSTNSSTIAGK